jgi:flagellar hook-basal body protein
MMSSLFAAVSGLKAHQERIDVIGNNIANVNTAGFKKSRVSFADMLYHTISGASRPVDGGPGGTNPMQKGPGVSVASIDTIFAGSNLQDTGKETDLGISGDGFFIVSDGQQNYFTRAGNFDFDEEGNLVSLLTGMRVQGWTAVDGNINTSAAIGNINIPTQGVSVPAKATTTIDYAGNLDAGVNGTLLFSNGTGTTTFSVEDGAGNSAVLKLTLEATDSFNSYNWLITTDDPGVEVQGTGRFTLDNNGMVTTEPTGSVIVNLGGDDLTISPPADGGSPEQFTVDGSAITIESLDFTPAASRVARQTIYDSLGDEYTVTTTFTRVADSQWDWEAKVTKSTPTGIIDIPLQPGTGVSVLLGDEFTLQQQQMIADMVASAAGVRPESEDRVTVTCLPFGSVEEEAGQGIGGFWNRSLWFIIIIIILVAAFLLFWLLRRNKTETMYSEQEAMVQDLLNLKQQEIMTPSPEQKEEKEMLGKLRKLARNNSKDTAEVLKSWLSNDQR